jgi:glycosyltransferase involved in cell wall biosynthesis
VKILFATEYWPPFAPGGAEWTNSAWAAALARRGHDVVVVTPNYGAEAREAQSGVRIVRVPFPVKLARGQAEAGWLLHRNPVFHAYFAWWIARVARAMGAELVHAQNKGALVAAWLAARFLRRPLAVTIRDVGLLCPLGACTLFEPWDTFDCSSAQYVRRCVPYFLDHYAAADGVVRRARRWAVLLLAWLDQRLRHRALSGAQRIIGVSHGILGVYPSRLVNGGRARVVHSLTPRVSITPEAAAAVRKRFALGDGPLVLYAGKRSLGKGTAVLLEAMDEIRASVPGVRLAFAGKGDFPLPARDDIVALGSLDQPTLFGLYAAADVVVVPSVWPEPLSRVLIEAMYLGRPVVASAVGGSPEVVEDGVTGVLVPRGDAAALARAVSALLRDPDRRARMGVAASRRAAQDFDEGRLVDELLDAYAGVTGARA